MTLSKPGVDDEIAHAALFGVGHLQAPDVRKLLLRHAGPREDARALDMEGCGDGDDGIDPARAAAFEEQRDIENDKRRAALAMTAEEGGLPLAHHRVHDAFEALQCLRIAEHGLAERGTVEAGGAGHAGKFRLDRGECATAGGLQPVNLRIGIEDGNALGLEHLRDGGFSHADGTGQTDDLHRVSALRSAASSARGGSVPKSSVKAVAAWPISMARPSMATRPQRRASWSRPVSSGA